LCDFHVGYADSRVDLYGIFNALHPAVYPHHRRSLVIFAHMVGGIGDVPFYFELHREQDDQLIRRTSVNLLRFPDRTTTVQFAMTLEGVVFDEPGVYVVSLFCHNTWVCDTTLLLH